jgi:hypothetical protein
MMQVFRLRVVDVLLDEVFHSFDRVAADDALALLESLKVLRLTADVSLWRDRRRKSTLRAMTMAGMATVT